MMIDLNKDEVKHLLAAMGLYFHSMYKLANTHETKEAHRRIVRKLVHELNTD